MDSMNSDIFQNGKEIKISEYQKRFWIEWALAPTSSAYNTSMVYKIKGNLDTEAIKKACDAFTQNHVITHAIFNQDGSKQFYGKFTIDDFFKELVLPEQIDAEEFIKTILDEPYDLTNGPLFNNFLISIKSDEYYFFLKAQHVISDAVFMGIWAKEIANYYNAIILKTNPPQNNSKCFTECLLESKMESLGQRNKSRIFWEEYLDDLPLSVPFPTKKCAVKNSLDADSLHFYLSEQETTDLKQFAKTNKTTLFIVLSALYGVLLSKYSSQQEILLSYPINVRPKGYKNTTGCFVNNLPLKIDLRNNYTFKEVIADITQHQKKIKSYQSYLFTDLIQNIRKKIIIRLIST